MTPDARDRFLALVRSGLPGMLAARKLDPPTTMMRILRDMEGDQAFAAAYLAARDEGLKVYAEKLRAEALRHAMGEEGA